jgi:pimeloyl-ACP methyl ester carboxylesterase
MKFPTLQNDPHMTFRTNMMWAASPKYLETREPKIASEMVMKCLIKNPHLDAYHGLLGHLEADEKYDALDQLDQIKAPTLITAGEIDMLVPKRYSEIVHTKITHAQYHEFKGEHASHFALWEMADEFTSVSLGFMMFVEATQTKKTIRKDE